MKKLLLLCAIAINFSSLHSMSMNPEREARLNKLHEAAEGWFFGRERFTRKLNKFYDINQYTLTKPEARSIAETAQSYQIFSFQNEVVSYRQLGLGILTVLYICTLPAMLEIGRHHPSVTTGSIGVAGLLGGTIAIAEIAKRINSKNQDRIYGIKCDLSRKIPNYMDSQD